MKTEAETRRTEGHGGQPRSSGAARSWKRQGGACPGAPLLLG